MNMGSPVTDPVTSFAAAPAILAAATTLFGHLERGQHIRAATLRDAMEASFGASDSTGAWDWKMAYEACEVATVLFIRKYGKALFRKAASPAARLAAIARIVDRFPGPHAPVRGKPGVAAILDARAARFRRYGGRRNHLR